MIINDLSKKDKVGQKFIVGINSCNIDDIILVEYYYIRRIIVIIMKCLVLLKD